MQVNIIRTGWKTDPTGDIVSGTFGNLGLDVRDSEVGPDFHLIFFPLVEKHCCCFGLVEALAMAATGSSIAVY